MENRDKYWEKRNKTMIIWEYGILWTSLVTQMVKNLSAMCDTQIQSLGQEDLLEKGILCLGNKDN